MSNPINDGGQAFPCIGSETFPHDPHGMSLRDWFAGKETLAEWDIPEERIAKPIAEALAGYACPAGDGWTLSKERILAVMRWEADWRAAIKYLRADAMLKAKESKP